MTIRHRIDPRDIPPVKAARYLGLLLADFESKLPQLLSRGFPPADETTGNYDLDAINEWRKQRYPHLYLTDTNRAIDAGRVANDRIRALFDGAKTN